MQSLFEAYEPDQKLLQQTRERCETEFTQLSIKLRQGDYDLHLPVIQRAIPFSFTFVQVNYKR